MIYNAKLLMSSIVIDRGRWINDTDREIFR